jgi:multiple antibiotic resistance protein
MVLDTSLIIQIFVLLNPFASFTFLMAAYKKKMNVKIIAGKSVIVAFLIAVIITLFGPFLFSLFGITLDSFRIAAGVVLLLLAISMVRPQERHEIQKVNSLITIIAIPLLTGPATISFITIKAFEIGTIPVLLNLCAAFLAVGAVFILFSIMITKINVTVVDIMSRVTGLFLSAVAIEMMAKGVEGIAKSLV